MDKGVSLVLGEARAIKGYHPSPLRILMFVGVFSFCYFVLACFFDAFWIWFESVLILFCYGSA